jgi:Flp pilus assembly protein TadG
MLLIRQRRGSIAMMTGLMAPVLLMTTALGIEVVWWSTTKVELQRVADIGAWAGAMQYAQAPDGQLAAGRAADMARLNGVTGTVARTWNSTSKTLTQGHITAQVVSGVRNTSQAAMKLTVSRDIATSFSRIIPGVAPFVVVSATSIAEIGILEVGPQPCMTALGEGVDGITTDTDITFSGSINITATGCSIRSNSGITKNGNGTVTADAGVYAGGTISSGICCNLHPKAGQIPDPYASHTLVKNAFSRLSGSSSTTVNVGNNATTALQPGTTGGWSVNGRLSLSPGLYIVNGPISLGAQGSISGSNVTIVTSGTVDVAGGSTLTLSAATTAQATAGAIPGIVFAGTNSGAVTIAGNASSRYTGVVYFPHADLKFSGTSSAGSTGCLQVIASTIVLSGNTQLASSCSQYGTNNYGSLPAARTVALVQ